MLGEIELLALCRAGSCLNVCSRESSVLGLPRALSPVVNFNLRRKVNNERKHLCQNKLELRNKTNLKKTKVFKKKKNLVQYLVGLDSQQLKHQTVSVLVEQVALLPLVC